MRDGDVVIVGCDTERMDMASLHGLRSELRLALGDVNPIFVAGHPGVTVLRPERAA